MPPYSADVRLRILVQLEILRIQRDRLKKLTWDTHCERKRVNPAEPDDADFFKMWALTPDGVLFAKSIQATKKLSKILNHPHTSLNSIEAALHQSEGAILRGVFDFPTELTEEQMAELLFELHRGTDYPGGL